MGWQHAGRVSIAAALMAWMPAGLAADGDPARGAKLAYACLGCHGSENAKNAYPKYSVPKLGGQNAAYIVAALGQYAAGSRSHPTMRGYASTLSPAERADIAAYFAAEAVMGEDTKTAEAPPAQAEACVACHGQTGAGTIDEYPDIGGQHADYLAQALRDYRLGKRRNPIMAPFAQQLTREEAAALAAYYASQPGLVTPTFD